MDLESEIRKSFNREGLDVQIDTDPEYLLRYLFFTHTRLLSFKYFADDALMEAKNKLFLWRSRR